jgi:hypothetical protein
MVLDIIIVGLARDLLDDRPQDHVSRIAVLILLPRLEIEWPVLKQGD